MNDVKLNESEQNLIPYTATSVVGQGPVLVLAPHPDDEVLGPGGALALHCAAGDNVSVVIVTDGGQQLGKSTFFTLHQPRTRIEESIKAGTILGYKNIKCWHLPDRGLANISNLTQLIIDLLQTSQARLVYAPSPYENHPDHRVLSLKLAEAANFLGGDTQILGYEISGTLRPNLLIDISPVISKKLKALKCFRSQLALRPYDQYIAGLNRYRAYTLSSQTKYVEAYLAYRFYEAMQQKI